MDIDLPLIWLAVSGWLPTFSSEARTEDLKILLHKVQVSKLPNGHKHRRRGVPRELAYWYPETEHILSYVELVTNSSVIQHFRGIQPHRTQF
jgi:hypothetical protein